MDGLIWEGGEGGVMGGGGLAKLGLRRALKG